MFKSQGIKTIFQACPAGTNCRALPVIFAAHSRYPATPVVNKKSLDFFKNQSDSC
jgi:hypothetical protein